MWQCKWRNLCKWLHLVAKFANNANGAIWWPNLQLMQVVPSGGQIFNECKSCHLVAKFATNASVAMLLPNLVQFTESISGSIVPLAMFFFFSNLGNPCWIGQAQRAKARNWAPRLEVLTSILTYWCSCCSQILIFSEFPLPLSLWRKHNFPFVISKNFAKEYIMFDNFSNSSLMIKFLLNPGFGVFCRKIQVLILDIWRVFHFGSCANI